MTLQSLQWAIPSSQNGCREQNRLLGTSNLDWAIPFASALALIASLERDGSESMTVLKVAKNTKEIDTNLCKGSRMASVRGPAHAICYPCAVAHSSGWHTSASMKTLR